MNQFLTGLKELDNYTETENGAVALKSTNNYLVDAFGKLGAMRDSSAEDIIKVFDKAYFTDKTLAMKLLFYIRDIRGGQGERNTFRIIAKHLADINPNLVSANLDNFLFFGRGDDVLCLLDTELRDEVIGWISSVLKSDYIAIQNNGFPSMLAKWLPSENASSKETKNYARIIREGLGWSSREYRKTLSKLRAKINIVETLMSQNRWDEIDFEKLPSKASMIYSDAFMNHVKDNYIDYLKRLASGNAKVNAGALYPYDIAHKILNSYNIKLKDRYLLDAMWKTLPDYFEGKEENAMCVVDTSGSMYGQPMEVAYSLGLYCADKAKGPFHNHFITFSSTPKLQEIVGDNVVDKIKNMDLGICENTNIEAVFDLILDTAKLNNLKQEDLPAKLYIISDMQWDEAVRDNDTDTGYMWNSPKRKVKPETFISKMRKKYVEAGYNLPLLVYWNVRTSKCGMFQQGSEDDNCCMVSGFSSSLFKSVIEGTTYEEEIVEVNGEKKSIVKQKLNPVDVMIKTLSAERYDRVIVNE